ncbi:A24 family peptidase [Endozoicomonas atrinae]|uniref:A24 family peptidase n=1 Tax=Endozoicomonas atrinae TaxID=1333660 RepID=UPI0008261544|nr:A24 family peptidase [Endozoicomonas atrinae]
MNTPNSDQLPTLLLLAALIPALWYDLRYRRLPNWLTFSLFITGLMINSWLSGFSGLLDALGGGFLCLAMLLPFYLMKKGMGAGDVKMVAAIGAVLGVKDGALCTAAILIAGAVLGLLYLIYKGGLVVSLRRYWLCLMARTWLLPAENEAASLHFPYGLAIASGLLITLYGAGDLAFIPALFSSSVPMG